MQPTALSPTLKRRTNLPRTLSSSQGTLLSGAETRTESAAPKRPHALRSGEGVLLTLSQAGEERDRDHVRTPFPALGCGVTRPVTMPPAFRAGFTRGPVCARCAANAEVRTRSEAERVCVQWPRRPDRSWWGAPERGALSAPRHCRTAPHRGPVYRDASPRGPCRGPALPALSSRGPDWPGYILGDMGTRSQGPCLLPQPGPQPCPLGICCFFCLEYSFLLTHHSCGRGSRWARPGTQGSGTARRPRCA